MELNVVLLCGFVIFVSDCNFIVYSFNEQVDENDLCVYIVFLFKIDDGFCLGCFDIDEVCEVVIQVFCQLVCEVIIGNCWISDLVYYFIDLQDVVIVFLWWEEYCFLVFECEWVMKFVIFEFFYGYGFVLDGEEFCMDVLLFVYEVFFEDVVFDVFVVDDVDEVMDGLVEFIDEFEVVEDEIVIEVGCVEFELWLEVEMVVFEGGVLVEFLVNVEQFVKVVDVEVIGVFVDNVSYFCEEFVDLVQMFYFVLYVVDVMGSVNFLFLDVVEEFFMFLSFFFFVVFVLELVLVRVFSLLLCFWVLFVCLVGVEGGVNVREVFIQVVVVIC